MTLSSRGGGDLRENVIKVDLEGNVRLIRRRRDQPAPRKRRKMRLTLGPQDFEIMSAAARNILEGYIPEPEEEDREEEPQEEDDGNEQPLGQPVGRGQPLGRGRGTGNGKGRGHPGRGRGRGGNGGGGDPGAGRGRGGTRGRKRADDLDQTVIKTKRLRSQKT